MPPQVPPASRALPGLDSCCTFLPLIGGRRYFPQLRVRSERFPSERIAFHHQHDVHFHEDNLTDPGLPGSSAPFTGFVADTIVSPLAVTGDSLLERAIALVDKADYRTAAELLCVCGDDPFIRNLLGVCWMRCGKSEQAVQLYRKLVLVPGSVQERHDIPDAYKRNFATALLLQGIPSGAMEILSAMRDSESLVSVRIRSAIIRWERTLSLFRWLDWKLNRIEPPGCHVPVEFEPGELELESRSNQPGGATRRDFHLGA